MKTTSLVSPISPESVELRLGLGNFEATWNHIALGQPTAEDTSAGMEDYQAVGRLWNVAQARVSSMPASTQFHGAWPGGLNDHLNDMLLFVVANAGLYDSPLSLPQWGAVVLLHDWEKLWKYVWSPQGKFIYRGGGKSGHSTTVTPAFRIGAWLQWSGIRIHPDMLNALTMSEGGWSPEARTCRDAESSGSAALLHAADMFSAKVRKLKPSVWARNRFHVIDNPCSVTYQTVNEYMIHMEKENPVERVLWPS
jgi:hypothetical protein